MSATVRTIDAGNGGTEKHVTTIIAPIRISAPVLACQTGIIPLNGAWERHAIA